MSIKYEIVTAARLREVLDYSPETGVLTWRVPKGRNAVVGRAAGTLNANGYIAVMVDQYLFLAHRIAWCHTYGVWPSKMIDHINGCRTDNRLTNLRDVDCKSNLHNSIVPQRRGTSGYRGVSYDKRWKKWVASIYANGVKYHLGAFETPELAAIAYMNAKRIHHNYVEVKP